MSPVKYDLQFRRKLVCIIIEHTILIIKWRRKKLILTKKLTPLLYVSFDLARLGHLICNLSLTLQLQVYILDPDLQNILQWQIS